MGFYSIEELPEHIGQRTPMFDLERMQYWHQLSEMGLYDATTYKASNIHDPRIRILHRIITIAFYGCHESIGNVTYGDLEIMYAILSGQFLCPARMLTDEFIKMSGKLSSQAISGGAFITLLTQGSGMDTDDLTVVNRNIGLTLQSHKNIKVVGTDRHRHFLISKSGRECTEDGPRDGEDLRVQDFSFAETPDAIREMLTSRPQVGLSHSPLSTYHQSPPRQDYPHSHTYEAGHLTSLISHIILLGLTMMISCRGWVGWRSTRLTSGTTPIAKPSRRISVWVGLRVSRQSCGTIPTSKP